MRILVGTDTYPPDVNGAAYHTARLVAGLAARGHEVHVLCPSQGHYDATVARERVTEHRLMSWRTPLHPSFRVCSPLGLARVAAAAIGEIQPDVIHVQGHFPIGRALSRAATAIGCRSVATNHFMPDNLLGYTRLPDRMADRLTRWAWRDATRVLDRADTVTAPTHTAVRLLRTHGLSAPGRDRIVRHQFGPFPTPRGTPVRPGHDSGCRTARRSGSSAVWTAKSISTSPSPLWGPPRRMSMRNSYSPASAHNAPICKLRRSTLGVAEHVHFLGYVRRRGAHRPLCDDGRVRHARHRRTAKRRDPRSTRLRHTG